ncbi:MAG: hypothetical protein QHC90_30320 [Shinella sp.]|nr:hypothetical protein [Shinella sp.]
MITKEKYPTQPFSTRLIFARQRVLDSAAAGRTLRGKRPNAVRARQRRALRHIAAIALIFCGIAWLIIGG